MTATPQAISTRTGIVRDGTTWYAYLMLGAFTYLVSIQGNILPFLQAELDLSYGTVSLHTSSIAIGIMAVGLFGERAITRFGRRTMLAFGGLGAACAAVVLTIAPAAWATIASCSLFGLFGAFVPAIVPAVLSERYGDKRDIAITESNAVAYAFAILAPLIAGASAALGWSWRTVPLAGTAMCVAIVVAFRHRVIPEGPQRPGSARAPLPPAFWAYWFMLGFCVATEFSVLLWAPAFLERVVGLSPGNAAVGAGAFFVAMLVGRTVGVSIVRAFDGRAIFLAVALTTCIGFAAYWGGAWVPAALGGLFVVGLGISLFFPLALSMAMAAAPGAGGRASARVMLAPGIAILLNPPLLGALADRFGLATAQLTTPIFVLCAVLAFAVGNALTRPAAGEARQET